MNHQSNHHASSSVGSSPQQLFALQTLHEAFSAGLGKTLGQELHSATVVKVRSVESIRLSEYLFSRQHPTCMVELCSESLGQQWLAEVAPDLAYALIDTLLGGRPSQGANVGRPLTELEWRVLNRVFQSLASELNAAWDCVHPLDLHVGETYSNPQLAQIIGPMESVIVVQLDLDCQGGRSDFNGALSLCLPAESLVPFTAHLLKEYFTAERKDSSHPSPAGWHMGSVEQTSNSQVSDGNLCPETASAKVVANLARSSIRASDLMQLQVGDIVTTEQSVDQELEVEIQGVGDYAGRVGALDGKKAIEITRTPLDDRPQPNTTSSDHPQELTSDESLPGSE